MSNNLTYDFIRTLFFTTIFFLSYILFYNQVFNRYPSDLVSQIGFIDKIVSGEIHVSHPMFHYISYYLSKALSIDIKISSILMNAFLVLFLAVVIYKILIANLPKQINKYLVLFLVFIVMYSGSFFLPGLDITKHQYLGNGSITVWHNVTLYMVKPFAFLSFFLFFYALRIEHSRKYLTASLFFAILSIFAKPSFIVMYVPMLFVVLIYAYYMKNQYKKVLYYFLFLSLFTLLSLGYQYYITYEDVSNSGVVIALFEVWHLYSNNILLSIVVGNLFVVTFVVLAYRYISLESYFAILLLLIGIALFAIFAESGPRFRHGNFGWSYLIAQQIVFLSLIIDFYKQYASINVISKNLLLIALSLQIVDGLYYFIKIFNGSGYV